MKLLRVVASNFKNCCDNFTIDFIAKSKKTSEDKEYELQAVADELYVFNTVAFVGKNASGKTTAVDLLDCCCLSARRASSSTAPCRGWIRSSTRHFSDGAPSRASTRTAWKTTQLC